MKTTRTRAPDAMPGDYVMLSVSDTGTGMTDEVKAHLFEAFFTTKPMGKGTGLGLATCQTIVQQSGGHIDVHSELGKGTTFKIYFPRVEQPLDVAAKPIQTGPLPRGTETLLVVEDEPSVRHLARGVLEAQGYEVLSASNGQDALHVAREHKGPPIRLVVTDVIMPLMGGKVMAEWLKTTYPDLKILFTSGYTDDAIAQHGVLEPGVEFLPKPYTPATLARKVREMLDNETESTFLRKQDAVVNQYEPTDMTTMKARIIRRLISILLPALLAAISAGRLEAYELNLGTNLPPVDFHGFFSQGFLASSNYNYLGDSSRGSFLFHRGGLERLLQSVSAHAHRGAGFYLRCRAGRSIRFRAGLRAGRIHFQRLFRRPRRAHPPAAGNLQRHPGRGRGADICAAPAGNV